MILEFIRSLRRRTDRTKAGSAALLPLAMLLVVFMCFFIVYTFRRSALEYCYEQTDSNLTYALLAAAIINLDEYVRSGNLIIADSAEPAVGDAAFANSYLRFLDCLKSNLGLDAAMHSVKGQGLTGEVEVNAYRIYNYVADGSGWHITECGIRNGQHYTLRYPDNVAVYVEANDGVVRVTETSVYARISFSLEGLGAYSLTRLVAVTV